MWNLYLRTFNRFYCKQIGKIEVSSNFWKDIKHSSKIPIVPIKTSHFDNISKSNIKIDSDIIQLLERLSLVDLEHKKALKTLQDSIQFADLIININTENIKPLYTVLEDQQLDLRGDIISDGDIKDDILKNAKFIEEDYFVAPPGNIPLQQEEKVFDN